MGFLGNLFGSRSSEEPKTERYTIDIQGDCFIINGKRIEVPMHIDAFTAVLGKPRAEKFKTKPSEREFFEKVDHEYITQRVNYMWDDLGLKCYTHNGSVVNTFAIELQKADYETKKSGTKTKFKGTVTINGKPWFDEMMSGKDMEVFRRKVVGNYSLVAEYTDFEQEDASRTENDFTGIEITLGSEDDPWYQDGPEEQDTTSQI